MRSFYYAILWIERYALGPGFRWDDDERVAILRITHGHAMSQTTAPQTASIDAHAHWLPQPYLQYAEQQGGNVSCDAPSPLMYDFDARIVNDAAVKAASNLRSSVRDYIRRFHYDTLAYYPEKLRFMIELVGADRMVIGTDNHAKMDVAYPNALA